MSESFLAAAEARFTASAGSTPPPSAVIESLCSGPSTLTAAAVATPTPAVMATLTPAVVATPTQLAQAPAEVPCDEELPLTLQAYPHLRNTPAAKGWRPPPVMTCTSTCTCTRTWAPRPRGATPPYTPCTLLPLAPVRALAASRRAAQHIAHGRDGSPRWLPTRHGNRGLRACQCREPPASASPVEGACSEAGVCQRCWSLPTDPASPVSLAGIAATANPEKPRKPGLYLLWRSHMARRRARQLARAAARCTHWPGRAARRGLRRSFWWTAPLPPEGCTVTPYHSRRTLRLRTLRLTNPQADEPSG